MMHFLDTSYILALELQKDQNHQQAQRHWQGLRTNIPDLLTSTYVFDEVVTFFNSRDQHKKAVDVGTSLLMSPKVTLIHINQELFTQGWAYFSQHKDKRYSLTDCLSFILMREYQISTALTFDHHFVQAGFTIEPKA